MTSVSTEDFPYTAAYVTQLLGVGETELMNFVRTLAMVPQVDERTQRVTFTHADTERLRKAIEMNRRGESLDHIAQSFGVTTAESAVIPTMPTSTFGNQMAQQPVSVVSSSSLQTGSGSNLAMVVEAVSSAKEGILNDMSRLLDDKLAGLDEVVVELIRCKSENDTLKQKVTLLASEKQALEDELSCYAPAGFGFYRKEEQNKY